MGLRGGDLGAIFARLDVPKFKDTEFTNARNFIAQRVPELREIGRNGLDPVYGLAAWPDIIRTPAPLHPPKRGNAQDELWRIWTSPKTRYALSIDNDSGAVAVALRDAASPGTKILPLSAGVHREIGAEFLCDNSAAPLEENVRKKLSEALETDVEWWRTWFAVLDGSAVATAWSQFRRRALEARLTMAIRAAGVPESQVQVAIGQIVATRAGKPTDPEPESKGRNSGTPPSGDRKLSKGELVAIVRAIAGQLTEDQLRALPLPLGLVVDCLACRTPEK